MATSALWGTRPKTRGVVLDLIREKDGNEVSISSSLIEGAYSRAMVHRALASRRAVAFLDGLPEDASESLLLSGVHAQPLFAITQADLDRVIGIENMFETLHDALVAARNILGAAAPIPLPPPVMTAVRPFIRRILVWFRKGRTLHGLPRRSEGAGRRAQGQLPQINDRFAATVGRSLPENVDG